jgi:hypothetical protein
MLGKHVVTWYLATRISVFPHGNLSSRKICMSSEVRLSDRIAVEDVQAWPDAIGEELTFSIGRSAEFEAGAEGLALGYLSASIMRATSIHIACDFDLPKDYGEFCRSILSTMFGYALLRACFAVRFRNGENVAPDLRRFAGRVYDERRGVIGLGDRVGIIAFDPKRPIPRVFHDGYARIDGDSIPLPSNFSLGVSRTLSEMGVGEIASQSSFPILMEFVFETFVNTLQHGRPENPAVARHSTRGISITKIAFNPSQLERRGISEEMRGFLLRVAEMERTEKEIFVACISVMDMGGGIQNTLPPSDPTERPESRLLRAFNLRETRKSAGPVERGMGLLKVVDAAFLLGARLQVSSAGQRLVKDFSLGEDKLPSMQGATVERLPAHFVAGTCVDLLVPRLLNDIDQRKLAL